MRSRAFFFTTVALIGAALIIGMVVLWQQRPEKIVPPTSQKDGIIRMNKTVRGEVIQVMQSAKIITIKDVSTTEEIQIAFTPETKFVDEKNKSVESSLIHIGYTIEGKGESIAKNAMLANDIRIITSPEIIITIPTENTVATSPLLVEGLARGMWYFEAVFGVEIIDANRKLLGKHYVTATEDWMSESLVPFKGEFEFKKPTTKTGFLIFRNDNPSGLKEHEKSFEVPVNFELSSIKINVFFNNSKLDPAFLCDKVFPSTREIPWTEGIGRAAIEELLKGPMEAEKAADYFTNINPNVRINTLTIENGVAYIDFSEELDKAVGGSCRVTAIRAQITETLKQFPSVKEVVIAINGRTEDILQP
ncbi:MAG: hypothetical protein ACD_81C00138G0008 [uncultured bacterium]|uniref:GerMN domain-containing protein n=1 Tax=Candidatus Wolfebacteria bacterium GW2011_GWE2_44_13 TaxID=1619017 RepID=A0A0G1JIN7_9BACT|nr:MAG: hypothetical protein ACD_81C00138G0008 [uncultured bacterium]KKT43847.1 MAG: hypothetical protein UW32_C0001G0439 [Candidatus Wolfebacteria bacterium GW2011_GWE2_44_13]